MEPVHPNTVSRHVVFFDSDPVGLFVLEAVDRKLESPCWCDDTLVSGTAKAQDAVHGFWRRCKIQPLCVR